MAEFDIIVAIVGALGALLSAFVACSLLHLSWKQDLESKRNRLEKQFREDERLLRMQFYLGRTWQGVQLPLRADEPETIDLANLHQACKMYMNAHTLTLLEAKVLWSLEEWLAAFALIALDKDLCNDPWTIYNYRPWLCVTFQIPLRKEMLRHSPHYANIISDYVLARNRDDVSFGSFDSILRLANLWKVTVSTSARLPATMRVAHPKEALRSKPCQKLGSRATAAVNDSLSFPRFPVHQTQVAQVVRTPKERECVWQALLSSSQYREVQRDKRKSDESEESRPTISTPIATLQLPRISSLEDTQNIIDSSR